MNELKNDLGDVLNSIRNLEMEIQKAKEVADENVKSLELELDSIRQDKRRFASKSDFESVQSCRRKEDNLKFRINAQWNEYSLLKNELSKLKKKKDNLEGRIKLEEDKIKRKKEILSRMDRVIANYKKSQNLTLAATDSNISPDHVMQWYEWGKNDYDETYSYFYSKILEADDYFKNLEALKLKKQMDDVIDAFKITDSPEKASQIAQVSYDTVRYWYEWGSRGFGEENTYFYNKLKERGFDVRF